MDRDPYGPGLVGEGPGHGLTDPPGGVRRELVAARVVELLNCPDQAQVSLLDQIEHGQPAADIPLGHGHDEPQIRLDEAALGHPAHHDEAVQVQGELTVQVGCGAEPLLGEQTGLDAAGELDLLDRGQQGDTADLAQVLAEQVRGRATGVGGAGPRRCHRLGVLRGLQRLCGRFRRLGRALRVRLRVVHDTGLRGDRDENLGLGLPIRAVRTGVGLGEGLGQRERWMRVRL